MSEREGEKEKKKKKTEAAGKRYPFILFISEMRVRKEEGRKVKPVDLAVPPRGEKRGTPARDGKGKEKRKKKKEKRDHEGRSPSSIPPQKKETDARNNEKKKIERETPQHRHLLPSI